MSDEKELYIGMPIDLEHLAEAERIDWMPDGMDDDPACICDSDFRNWPLAMAYVPMQSWEEPYAPDKALQAGTIFPSLDLPFLGGGGR